MPRSDMSRRDFSRLTMAALGGVVAGAAPLALAEDKEKEHPMLRDPHICCGLNTCKGKGKDKKNECAGMGNCATAKEHTCSGENECRGLGGCGEKPGQNECKGKGDCGVPLEAKAWKKARPVFESAMKKAEKKFGDAPKSCPGAEKK